ncbi:MAG TPA: fused MFS/spermidine synthase [Burkholderiaceae bacterium]|nr:fused MFS/spermidine synthase [Burkholderiaceae bacterium]
MQKRGWILFAGVLALAVIKSGLVISNLLAGERLVHTEPSEFAPIVVFEQYGERCMNFNDIEGEGRQTCMQLKDPDRMVFEYTRMMTSALFVNPAPQSILIIGLGGATLPTALHKLLPTTVIDTVEIDPAVVKVAQRYFGYQVGPRQRVHVDDGRAFVERALADGRRYDMVMLDAFDVDYIPAHLLTVEFLEHVRSLLSDTGVVVANSFAQSRMYERESATYATVFGEFFNLRAGLEGNRVIVATVGPLPSAEQLEHNARQLAKQLEPFGIDIDKALGAYDVHQEPPGQNLPLRDPPPDGG